MGRLHTLLAISFLLLAAQAKNYVADDYHATKTNKQDRGRYKISQRDATTAAPDSPIIDGYVAFGDSFAAGMGTGITSGEACRRGENSYPKLLFQFRGSMSADFQNLACSGDTIIGLQTQINQWTHPGNADVATVSIGGNDVGFSDIVIACITQTKTGFFSGDCDDEISKARTKMNRRHGSNALFNNTVAGYVSIYKKSVKPHFRVYVTGYPKFFNADTNSCDDTTFYYFSPWFLPKHDPSHQYGDPKLYLSKQKRLNLNRLVMDLNGFLQDAVNEANHIMGSEIVTFVDTNQPFEGHRFCERDGDEDVVEPDENRAATWFFLSNWRDFPIDPETTNATTQSAIQEREEMRAIIEGGPVNLLEKSVCESKMANPRGVDPLIRHRCAFRAAVNAGEPRAVQMLESINADIRARNYNSEHIKWWLPTRQIKTFHPRSTGQFIMRNAVLQAWDRAGASIPYTTVTVPAPSWTPTATPTKPIPTKYCFVNPKTGRCVNTRMK